MCGIVGLCELLSAFCFFTAILIYLDNSKPLHKNSKKTDEQEEKVQEETKTEETKSNIVNQENKGWFTLFWLELEVKS